MSTEIEWVCQEGRTGRWSLTVGGVVVGSVERIAAGYQGRIPAERTETLDGLPILLLRNRDLERVKQELEAWVRIDSQS